MDNEQNTNNTEKEDRPLTNGELIAMLQTRDPNATVSFVSMSHTETEYWHWLPTEIFSSPENKDNVIVGVDFVFAEPVDEDECDDCDEEECLCPECKTELELKSTKELN